MSHNSLSGGNTWMRFDESHNKYISHGVCVSDISYSTNIGYIILCNCIGVVQATANKWSHSMLFKVCLWVQMHRRSTVLRTEIDIHTERQSNKRWLFIMLTGLTVHVQTLIKFIQYWFIEDGSDFDLHNPQYKSIMIQLFTSPQVAHLTASLLDCFPSGKEADVAFKLRSLIHV